MSVTITDFPSNAKTSEPFVLKGTATNLDDVKELLIRVDNRFDVARAIVKNGKWEANLTLNQSGDRLIEVIASAQDKAQIRIKVDEIKQEPNEQDKNATTDQNIEDNEVFLNIINNDKLTAKEKRQILGEIRKSQPGLQDRWIYRFAVWTLSGTIALSIGSTFVLLFYDKDKVSDGLIGIGATSVGALAGLLTPTSKRE